MWTLLSADPYNQINAVTEGAILIKRKIRLSILTEDDVPTGSDETLPSFKKAFAEAWRFLFIR